MQTGNVEVRQRTGGWLKLLLVWLHLQWIRLRSVVAVLSIVRFSLLVPATLALTLVMADQMIDLLRAVGEDGEVGTWISLLIMTSFAALIVWYSARTMLRFRFVSNPASDPLIHPGLKRFLPRMLGISIPAMLALRVGFLAPESSAPRGVWLLTAALSVITLVVAFYVIKRRRIAERFHLSVLASSEALESRDLSRWRELPVTTRTVFIILLAANALVIALFVWTRFYEEGGPVALGASAILLLGLGLMTVTGSALVYFGNHYALPILSLFLLWGALCSINNDNHVARLTAESHSHGWAHRAQSPAAPGAPPLSLGALDLDAYFQLWWPELELAVPETPAQTHIPVFVIAAEGGGLRAAYWTASVLARLEDLSLSQSPAASFSRHVFAISGVSGGSVGAALFDAALAERLRPTAAPVSPLLDDMDRILGGDFLADTLGAGLFPDLLQRFLPAPLLDDRAIALERSFERAWARAHPEDPARLREPFVDLWRVHPQQVPLLFLNSTVVETGQRAISAPIATATPEPDGTFADVLPLGRFMGAEVPLSTAAVLSARFTYVSPAALIDTHRKNEPRWIRAVDGGYFDNSGASTAQELARALSAAFKHYQSSHPEDRRAPRLIVLHLANAPEIPSTRLNEQQQDSSGRAFLSEIFAPLVTLLHTRGARGTQAVSYLRGEPGIELLTIRPSRVHVVAPLGWVLSGQVRGEMRDQLLHCEACAEARLDWVREVLLDGNSPPAPAPAAATAGSAQHQADPATPVPGQQGSGLPRS